MALKCDFYHISFKLLADLIALVRAKRQNRQIVNKLNNQEGDFERKARKVRKQRSERLEKDYQEPDQV